MIDYLTPLFARLTAMQLEIPVTPAAASASAYFFNWGETLPYWTNRITDHQSVWLTEDQKQETYTVAMRYVVGHITEGAYGTPETILYAHEPIIQQYWTNHIGLTDDGGLYTTYLDYLDPVNVDFRGSNGFHAFPAVGFPGSQVGTEFHLIVPFIVPVTQSKWR